MDFGFEVDIHPFPRRVVGAVHSIKQRKVILDQVSLGLCEVLGFYKYIVVVDL